MSSKTDNRKERYQSHALVEFKKFRWLPFGIHSGVLLDLSLDGFKLEFTGDVFAKVNKRYSINIPLSPLGIPYPSSFNADVEVKWFDSSKHRIGGVFYNLSTTDTQLLTKLIETLKERGLGGA